MSDVEKEDLKKATSDRDDLITEITSSNIFHARVRWRRCGERGSKYFHDLKKRNFINSGTKALTLTHSKNSSVMSEDVSEMLTECQAFFEEMYRAPSVRLQENESEPFFANIQKHREGEAECCEGRITQLEIQTALSSLKKWNIPVSERLHR